MIVGLDVGNGSIGLFVKDGAAIVVETYPSVYGALDPNQTMISFAKEGTEKTLDVFTFSQREYVLGYENVRQARTAPIGAYDREQRFKSREYQTLTKLALLDAVTRTGKFGVVEIELSLGTPAEDYSEASIALLQSWFKEPVVGAKNGQQIVVMVKAVHVISQPIAVLMDVYLNDEGFVRQGSLEHQKVLVLDAGSGTLDISIFDSLVLVKQYSEPVGLNDVYQSIIESIQKEDPKIRVDAFDLEAQLRAQDGKDVRFYEYGPRQIDITVYYHRATKYTWEQLIAAVRRRCPDRSVYHIAILAGGSGDAWKEEFLEWMPSLVLSADPQKAVARGLGKYTVAQSKQEVGAIL